MYKYTVHRGCMCSELNNSHSDLCQEFISCWHNPSQTGQSKHSWIKRQTSKSKRQQVHDAQVQLNDQTFIDWMLGKVTPPREMNSPHILYSTVFKVQMYILTWVHHYWCTPTANLLRDQQTSPLFLRRSLSTGNPLLHLSYGSSEIKFVRWWKH